MLNGCKAVVSGADVADRLLVSARTSGGVSDWDGISLFLVPKNAVGPGVRNCMTIAETGAAEVVLDQVRLPAGALIGAEGKAAAAIEHALDRGIAAQCNQAVGPMAMLNLLTLD